MPFVPDKKGKRKMARVTAHPLRKYQVRSSMVCDFFKKEDLLHQKYNEISPQDFYKYIFGADYDRTHIAFFAAAPKGKRTVKFKDFGDLLVAAGGRSDAYIAPCDFYKNFRTSKCLNKLYAITIDIDGIRYVELRRLINAHYNGIIPTLVNHSGGGVHLIYVLSAPIDEECRPAYQAQIKAVFDGLREILRRPLHSRGKDYPVSYKVDNVGIIQQYRIVGSCTKLGYTTRAYRTGAVWEIEKLAEIAGVSWKKYEPPAEWSNEPPRKSQEYRRGLYQWYRERPQNPPEKVAYIDKTAAKHRDVRAQHGFWVHCDRRMCEVTEGNRHKALFALAVVAYKCGIPIEVLIERLTYWRDYYNKRDARQVRDDEITTALDGYNDKWVKVTAAKLEEWFGWTFPRRKNKHNGNTQAAHLQKVRDNRSEQLKARIAAFLSENPDASKKRVAEELGISRNTVAKYYV